MARGTTLLIFGVLAAALIAGAALGGLFSVGGSYDGPECFTITPTSEYSARFEAVQSEECRQQYGPAPYQYRWSLGTVEYGPSPGLTVEAEYPADPALAYNVAYFVFGADDNPAGWPDQPCGDHCPYIEQERIDFPLQYPPPQDPYTGNVTGEYVVESSFSYATSGSAVSLDMGASGGAPPYTFEIDWGDGTNTTNSDGTESHGYADGTYTISVLAVDSNGQQSDSDSVSVTFQEGRCTAGCSGTGDAEIDAILVAQIALGIVAAILVVAGAIYRRVLMIAVGAGVAVFALVLPLLV